MPAFAREGVPDFDGIFPGNPDLVAEVAGVAGTRDVHGHAGDFAAGDAKIFQVGDVGFGDFLEQRARGRALQGQRRHPLGDIFDIHRHAQGVLAKPAQAGVGGGPAIKIFRQAGDGAIVNHLALLIAPAAVDHLADLHFVDIARDHAIDQTGGIFAADDVLVQRRDVYERAGVADGVVLVLVVSLVTGDGVIARPFAVTQAGAQRKSSFVEGGADGQGYLLSGQHYKRG